MPRTCTKFVLLTVCLLFFSGSAWGAGPEKLPFKVGEEIEYTISWQMVPAGRATFKVMDYTAVDGQRAWHFVLEARSRPFIDFFYKIRDRLESLANDSFTRSMLYKKTQKGKADKAVVVRFDWENKKATYSNFGGKRPSIDIPDNTFDPLSSFYKLRTLDLELAGDNARDQLFFPVTDGKRCFIQKGTIVRKERLTLASGTYDTCLLIPQVKHFSGVFKKSDNPTVKVWVSDDERQVPVRIKVKVVIGSVIFDLASIR